MAKNGQSVILHVRYWCKGNYTCNVVELLLYCVVVNIKAYSKTPLAPIQHILLLDTESTHINALNTTLLEEIIITFILDLVHDYSKLRGCFTLVFNALFDCVHWHTVENTVIFGLFNIAVTLCPKLTFVSFKQKIFFLQLNT